MNTGDLKRLIEGLLADEDAFKIQALLSALTSALDQLISQPSNSTFRSSADAALKKLSRAIADMTSWYTPAQMRRLEQLGVSPAFSTTISARIHRSLADNPLSLQVTRNLVAEITAQRQQALKTLRSINEGLQALNINAYELRSGDVEVGFTIPRQLFHGDFDAWLNELQTIRRVLRTFSELATGSVEEIEVRQLSSSDPQIFVSLCAATALALGTTVSWILNQWKKLEEIRKLRAETKKIGIFSDDDIDKMYSAKIAEIVDAKIRERAAEMVSALPDKGGRKEEQETATVWSIKSLFSRIERGMVVEIRLVSPERQIDEEGARVQVTGDILKQVDQIADELVFPAPQAEPIVSLPPHP